MYGTGGKTGKNRDFGARPRKQILIPSEDSIQDPETRGERIVVIGSDLSKPVIREGTKDQREICCQPVPRLNKYNQLRQSGWTTRGAIEGLDLA